ncbi:MAG TPA: DUF4388 domain-containing protein [Chloroflexia bacterium]|nr:DUF4388 domain-containing protein [Chloroflexia bacterium]
MSEQRSNSVSIVDILQYVRKNTQTGRLLFQDQGVSIAELYFNKGHLIHAANGKTTGDDVVYQLLGNKTAQMHWERNAAPAEETVSRTDEILLMGALGILTENDVPVAEPEPAQPSYDDYQTLPADETPVISQDQTAPGTFTPTAAPDSQFIELSPAQAVPAVQTSSQAESFLPGGAIQAGTSSRLQSLLGDEVLRPPRFRRWSGMPLPFVSAYSIEAPDGLVKSIYDLLWRERFSGVFSYVIGPLEAMVMLYKGRAIHSRYADGRTLFRDQPALRQIIELEIPQGERNGVLIYPLEADFVHSYAALLMGEPELTGLSSQSVKINKLLNTLEQAQRTGVVHVTNNEENGYIFLTNGHKLGSYYEVEDVLEESILRVYQIVGKAGSVIDVLTSPAEERLFEFTTRSKGTVDIKQQLIELAQEIFGKRSSRIVQLISQAEDNAPSLKTYCNQARRVAQIFIDKQLADDFYERALFMLQELN